jgi:hypothetical protein
LARLQHAPNRIVDPQGPCELGGQPLVEPDDLQPLEAPQVFADDGDAGRARTRDLARRLADVAQERHRLAIRQETLPQLQQRRHAPFVRFELVHFLEVPVAGHVNQSL